MRPLWGDQKPEEFKADWRPLSQDLLQFLEAAVQQPERFRALVLIDPAFFQPHFILFWKFIKKLGLGYRHPLIVSARRRRREFDDLEMLFGAYRRRKIFRYLDNDALWAYINGIVQPSKNGVYQLAFSADWETQIYYTGISPDMELWRALPNLKMPILIIRGEESDTFVKSAAQRVKRIRPQTNILELEKSTHLVPLEKPQEVSEAICAFLGGSRGN